MFAKLAPDLADDHLTELLEVMLAAEIDAITLCNTTTARPESLQSANAAERGGLSGAPLFDKSTRVLAQLSAQLDGRLPIIGVGGISSPAEAYAKICAGASAVQLYTALIYGGLSLGAEIARGLDRLLEEDGFANVAEAVGSKRGDWL